VKTARAPVISVVIPTRNRAQLLAAMLDSLEQQTIELDRFEVVVVDDGSIDGTPDVCRDRARCGLIRYRRVSHGGIAQAKNFGLLAARAPIVLFLDDDDLAAPELLERHRLAHAGHGEPGLAVLGYTTWWPELEITPVMSYITDVGHLLFAYPLLNEERMLPYHCFWGGRSSCKREFLLAHGIFDPEFTTIIEDIELAYRLRDAGFAVLYDRTAVTYMARPITYREFCERCQRRGRALARFFELHPEADTNELADTRDADARWRTAAGPLPAQVTEVHELEEAIAAGSRSLAEVQPRLHELYDVTFKAFELKGIAGIAVDGPTVGARADRCCASRER
jgi:glycosyltransferase involved in cell wall biosynthesis